MSRATAALRLDSDSLRTSATGRICPSSEVRRAPCLSWEAEISRRSSGSCLAIRSAAEVAWRFPWEEVRCSTGDGGGGGQEVSCGLEGGGGGGGGEVSCGMGDGGGGGEVSCGLEGGGGGGGEGSCGMEGGGGVGGEGAELCARPSRRRRRRPDGMKAAEEGSARDWRVSL